MDSQNIRDSAFESVDAEDYGGEADARNQGDTSLDVLEQHQAREQARLLHRFRELRQWQQQQQEQLIQQQQMQLEVLKGEQIRFQSLLASQRGAQWGDGRVSRPEAGHRSPPMMTPPRRSGLGNELAKTMMAAMPPHASTDSGLVASMGDTLEPPKGSLPLPVMLPTSSSIDEDKYTNPELFSNPGSASDDLQAVDDRVQFNDGGSEFGSDNFYLPPLPPEPKEEQANLGASLNALQALMAGKAPNLLQQMFGQLPAQQKSLLLEQRQAAVQQSASPTFSPVQSHSLPHHSVPSAPVVTAVPPFSASSAGFAVSSKATFVPQSLAASYSQAGIRPQAPFQGPPQAAFQGPQAQFQGPQLPFQGQPRAPLLEPVQSQFQGLFQDLPAQASFPSSQRQVPPFQSTSSHSHHHQLPLNSQQLLHIQLQQLQQQHSVHPQQEYSQHLAQQPVHRQSQQAQLSRHMPSEPLVRTRASWEDGREEQRDVVREGESVDREEDEEEEDEEEEDLEVTVKTVVRNPEDRPITSGLQGRKTFEQLLEEQLADEQRQAEEEQRRADQEKMGPVKRPFLRKGQGIARFNQPIKRPPPKRPSAPKLETSRSSFGSSAHKPEAACRNAVGSRSSSGLGADSDRSGPHVKPPVSSRRAPEKKRFSGGKKQLHDEDPPQPEKLKLIKRKSETGKKSLATPRPQVLEERSQPTLMHETESEDLDEKDSIADDASFVAGIREREKKAPLEAAELDEFEALEDIADNMSLVSNSSMVQRLITPNKQRQKAAVSDLKTVLEKKKAAPSSPFERNTAMRSLLSVKVPCPPISQLQGPAQKQEQSSDDNDDTLVDEDLDADPGFNKETGVCLVDSDNQQKDTLNAPTELEGRDRESDIVKSVFSESVFNQGQCVNGLDFSRQFSLFDQHGQSSYGSDNIGTVSPTKSVTRKVATLQSRLNAANDTASLLQKLSVHAGFLSQTEQEEMQLKTYIDEDETGVDNSLLSTSVSRPQPMVIDGMKTDQLGQKISSGDKKDMKIASDEEDSDDTIEDHDDHDKQSSEEDNTGESSSPVDMVAYDHSELNSNNNNVNTNNNKNDEDWEDEEEWTTNAPQVMEPHSSTQSGSERMSETTPPTSKLMTRLFPKLKPKPTAVQQQQQQKIQMASSTNVGDGIQSKVLRDKLAELEAEIEKFRSENAALERLRREREEGVNKLKEEIARFDQEKTDELRRLEEFKAQEMKKLKHERKLFETYQKQVRSMPDKKEREEIETLKRQLSDLQDEMKRKESRWTSSVTRLKTRITELEGENTEMREELKMLERKRLEWMQTRSTQRPAQAQPTAVLKSTPRSSTPTNDSTLTNGTFQDNGNRSRPSANPAVLSGAVTMTTQVNGAGAAGKSASGGGGHNGSGGESMPRGQPATPSMIEGISPAAPGNNIDMNESYLAPKPASTPRAVDRPSIDKGNGQYEETQYSDGKVERVYRNGSREVLFANGTHKEISSDGQYFIVSFFNGDIKQVFPDQRVVYYYAESQTTHTTYPDRLEVLQFPNNQTEKHYPDGTHEITFPNQTVKYLFPNGTEESIFPDGTVLRIDKNGEKVLEFPNGQREIHTQQHKRREYPDGTVKTLHNDGRQETRYATGRVRLKDKDGNVILDRMY